MSTRSNGGKSRVLYFPHGGGPLPLLGERSHAKMVEFLTGIVRDFDRPAAILVISAHWEEEESTITSGASPSLIYDYFGFPEESYRITYPAPGSPALAREIFNLLKKSGLEAHLDDKRGFDHGLFVPLKIMYPDARIPCVQLSLLRSLDSAAHMRLGQALTELTKRDVLILGSGFSFHNLRAFFSPSNHDQPDSENEKFQQWLIDACTNERRSREDRERRLIDWASAPSARYCHPREDHLLPLHVCCGLTGAPGKLVFDGDVMGKRSIGVMW